MIRKIPTSLLVPTLILAASIFAGGCAAKPKQKPRQYSFWPPYPDEPRVQYLCSFQSSASVGPEKSQLEELVYGKEIQQVQSIVKPYGLDMWNGRIYVCDLRSSAVTILDIRNQKTLIMGRSGRDTLQTPSDICISPDGTKYVADLGRGNVAVFDSADRRIGTFDVSDGKPVGVAVYGDELFVCDFKNQCVAVLDRRSGSRLRTIGSPGQEAGQFVRPLGIAIDSKGDLYVTDVLNCRMQKFDRQGKVLNTFGIISANVGGFVRPKHIDVDVDGTIYVVDAAFQNVQLFDQVGRVYTFFGSAGSHPGAMFLPAGVRVHDGDLDLFQKYVHPAFEMQRLILVTNQFGDDKVAAYALGRLKPGMTVKDIEASAASVSTGTGETRQVGPGAPLPTTGPIDEELRGIEQQSPATNTAPVSSTEVPARK